MIKLNNYRYHKNKIRYLNEKDQKKKKKKHSTVSKSFEGTVVLDS